MNSHPPYQTQRQPARLQQAAIDNTQAFLLKWDRRDARTAKALGFALVFVLGAILGAVGYALILGGG